MSIQIIEEIAARMHEKLHADRSGQDFDTSFVSNIHKSFEAKNDLEKEIKRMKIDAHEARAAIAEYQRKEKKTVLKESKLIAELETLKSDVVTAESKAIDYEQKWEKSSARVVELSTSIQKLHKKESDKAEEVEGLVKRIEQLLQEARQNKAKGEERVKSLNEQLKSTREAAAQQQQLIADERERIEQLQRVTQGSMTTIAKSEDAIERMKAEGLQAAAREKALQEEVDRLKGEVERARLLLIQKEEDVRAAGGAGETEKADASLAECETRCHDLAEARNRAEALCQELHAELELEVEKSKQGKRERSQALSVAEGENKQLSQTVQDLRAEKEKLQRLQAESEREKGPKRLEIGRIEGEEEEAIRSSASLTQELQRALDEKRVLEIKEAEGRAKIIDVEGKLRDLTRQMQLSAKKAKTADAKAHDEKLQLERLKEEVQTLKRELAEKENEEELAVSAFEEELSSIEQEKCAAEAEVTALKQKLLDLQLATAGEPADAPSPVRSLSSEVVPPSEDDEMELGESPLVKATSATSLEPFIIAEPAEVHTQKEEDSDEYASDDMEYTEM